MPLVRAVASRAYAAVGAARAPRWPNLLGLCALFFWCAPVAADLTPDEVEFTAPTYEIPGDIETLGERWLYKFYWGGLPVAHASIEGRTRGQGEERELVVDMSAGTNSVISLLWRYQIDAHGNIYVAPFRPGTFVAEETEKGREMATRIRFDENGKVLAYRKKGEKEKRYEFEAPGTQEFMSTVYLLLNMDYEIGRTYLIDTLTGVSRFLLTAEVRGIEPYEFEGEEIDAYRLFVTTKELTDLEGKRKHFGSDFWVSAARPRRFLGSRSETKWGSVTLRLVAIEPLEAESPPGQLEFRQAPPPPVATGAEKSSGATTKSASAEAAESDESVESVEPTESFEPEAGEGPATGQSPRGVVGPMRPR